MTDERRGIERRVFLSSRKTRNLITLLIDPEEMARRGRIGAHTLHSRYDSNELAARARQGLLSKFEREVDPNGDLPCEERRRRAEHARHAHMLRMARISAIARRRSSSPDTVEAATEREAAHATA